MLIVKISDYDFFELGKNTHVSIRDHIGGFFQDYTNLVLDRIKLQNNEKSVITVDTEFIVDKNIQDNYPEFIFRYNVLGHSRLLNSLQDYKMHPDLAFENFLCSFNGSPHVSRKLLVAALDKFGYFTQEYSSKNFLYTEDELDGHLSDLVGDQCRYYRKFFIKPNDHDFQNTIYNLNYQRYDHQDNIYRLQHSLTKSFLHLVSETVATSYYPNLTEKCFYSVVTRGLFLAYAQPGWHNHLEKYYGFKRYTKLFNYRFDTIQNPVERLVELMSMISKFSMLSKDEWKDLYLLEQDTIEYNYNHYFSQSYLKNFNQHE